MSARYQLGPILRHMGACDGSLAWLAAGKRATFAEAWEAVAEYDWLYFLADRVDRRAERRAFDDDFQNSPRMTLDSRRAAYARHGLTAARIEGWLYDYARKNNCLVEVER